MIELQALAAIGALERARECAVARHPRHPRSSPGLVGASVLTLAWFVWAVKPWSAR